MNRRAWSGVVVAGISGISLTVAISSADARSKPAPKPALKLGEYAVKTSPALYVAGKVGERVPFLMDFTLTQTSARRCAGARGATGTVFCLTASGIGAYGTYSTTGVAANCTDGFGKPEVAQAWNPIIRIPASGHVNVVQTIRNDEGEPTALVRASLAISPAGVFTGTYIQTVYISAGGASFLGCTTGTLKLKGTLGS